jgi:CheY-like chemotaxis protein
MARILVIDDEEAIRRTIKTILESDGHTVTLAESGQAAAGAMSVSRFDVVIVDIFMPGLDGIEMIKLIGQRAPDMHVIAMSGAAFSGVANAPGAGSDFFNIAVGLGAAYCLQKPFGARELQALVQTCCAERDGSASKVA